MSKRSFEEGFESPNNIVILPNVEIPAKKPKLGAIPPTLPTGVGVVDDIHEPPPPTLALNPQVIPPSKEQKCKSDKIGVKTKVLSEKNVASNTSSNSEDAIMEKDTGNAENKSELDLSKNPPSKSWASNYLMSIGQSYKKPIKINLSARSNSTTTTIKESPQKDEDTVITNAGKKNQQVHIKKTEALEMQQPAIDKLQTPNHTKSNVPKCLKQTSVKVPVNNNPYNLSDPLPTLPLPANCFSITNSSHTHGYMEQISAKHWPTPAPLNDIGYYNYNIIHNFTPTMPTPVTNYTPHLHPNIGYYHYNVHNNNVYSTDRATNDRSYLDKIDKFLAKVNTSYDNRFDETKTGKDVTHKKSLSLKRHASDTLKPRCDIYQEDERDELNKKSRISKEILQAKDYKDFTKYTRKSNSVNTHEKEHTHEIKTNIKDDIIKENYKHHHDQKKSYKNKKDDAIKEEHRGMGKTKRSTFEDPKEDNYSNPKNKNKIARRERRSHSKSETDSTSHSPRRSEEPVHDEYKTKRVGKERSSSYNSRSSKEPVHDESKIKLEKTSKRKEKSSYSSRESEEPAHIEYKKKLVDKEKAYKDKEKYSSYSSRRSEEHERNQSKTKQINKAKASLRDKEKTPKKKVKSLAHSFRRSEEHELKHKTEKENKEKNSNDDRYQIIKEKIKQKIKQAKDEMKRLRRRQEIEETSDENKPKNLDNQKPSTSKQGNGSKIETSISDKSVNCVAQINNNSEFYNIDKNFDLRSKLSRQNLNHNFGKIRDKNCKTTETPLNQNLFISVANDYSDDALQVDKKLEKNARKIKNKKVKKIQLVINVLCEESETSESEENTKDKQKEKGYSFNAEDLSFLDDLNIDEIVNSLSRNKKESNVSKISTHNNLTNNTDEPYIISDDDSDASTVHLEEVDQAYDLVDIDVSGKTEFAEKDTKNMLRDLVNNDIPHAEQRFEEKNRENKEHKIKQEKDDMLLHKIKKEVSDEVNCTKCKKTENIPSENISPKVDEKEMHKRLFTPMMEIKEELIEILSDNESSTTDYLDILNLEKYALNAAAAQDKVQRDTTNISTSLSKMTNTQVKMEPINFDNVVPPNVVSTAKTNSELVIKENTAIFKYPNSNITKDCSLSEITHLHVAIKNVRKEIEDKAEMMIEPKLKINIPKEIAKDCSSTLSTINIVKDNAIIQHLEMKVEPEETKCNNEVSLKINAKSTSKDIVTIESEKDVLPEIGDTYDGSTSQCPENALTGKVNTAINIIVKDNAIIQHSEMKVEPEETKCDNEVSLKINSKINAKSTSKDIETIESEKAVLPEIGDTYDGSTSQCSEHALTGIVNTAINISIPAILDNTLNITESQKCGNKESDKETTKAVKATSDTGKKDRDKDTTILSADIADVPMLPENKNNLISESNKEHSVQVQQDAVVIKADLVQSLETQKGFNRMSKAINEKIQSIINKQTVTKADKNKLEMPKVSLPKDASSSKIASPANKKPGLLPTPKPSNLLPTHVNTFKKSLLSTPKSTSPARSHITANSVPILKNANPAKPPVPIPKSSRPANTKTETSLPATESSTPVNIPKNPLSNSKISTSANTLTPTLNPPTKNLSISNNPQTKKEANDGKPLRQTEKVFIENIIKKRMEKYLKKPYDITELLHTGKFSKIFKCRDEEGNDMVVKILSVKCDRYNMGVVKEQMLENLQRDIPEENLHFIRLHDGFSVGSQWSFLMEYYPKNLSQALEESKRPFHIDHVQELSKQLATAVAALRNHKIVHSDIKPGHVLLNSTNDRLKICGFDEAYYGQRKPLPNIGTINYRAPEIILGFSAGFSIDVWSTALVMYEMATKTKLFPGNYNNEILFKQICTMGYVPIDMITLSRFAHKHFDGDRFMRRRGENGQDIAILGPEQIYKNSKLLGSLRGVYNSEWGAGVAKWQKRLDLNKVFQFYQLLEHMLVMHPNHRLPIESVYASDFLLEVTHYEGHY